MSIVDVISDDLFSAGFAEWQNGVLKACVVADPVVGGIWSVSGVSVEYPVVFSCDMVQYAGMMRDVLDGSSNPVGKGWMVLEAERDYAVLVSDFFGVDDDYRRAYQVNLGGCRLDFAQYKFSRTLRHPWRVRDSAVLLSDQLDGFLHLLLEDLDGRYKGFS